MTECIIEGLDVDPKTLLDLGNGWTAYVLEVLPLSKPLEIPDVTKECLIAAFLAKVQGWHENGQARMGRDDRLCSRCGKYLNISIYSPDVENS